MYQRESPSGHTVTWEPGDDDLAAEAMGDVPGTGVSKGDLPEQALVALETATATKVQNRYAELHVNKYGTDSPYYDG